MRLALPMGRACRAMLLLIAALCLSSLRPEASADPGCRGCNIVDAGLLQHSLVGNTVYLLAEGDFHAVQIVAVNIPGRIIRWRDPRSGREGNDDARNYYSAASVNEARQTGRSGLSESERYRQRSILASCALWVQQDNSNGGLGSILLANQAQQACCNSPDSARWITPEFQRLCRALP